MSGKYSIFLVLILTGIVSGCGKDVSGTYKGSETITQASTTSTNSNYYSSSYGTNTPTNTNSAQPYTQNLDVTITINPMNGNSISGSWQDSTGTSNFTGTLSDDGNNIQNISVNFPQTTSSYGCPTGGTFTGSLGVSNGQKQISGTISSTTNSSSGCGSSTRSITTNKL